MICLIASGDYFSSYGGGQVYVRNLVNGLREQHYACCVVSIARTSAADRTQIINRDDNGVAVWQLSVPLASADPKQPADLQAPLLEALGELLLQLKPCVVHAHGAKVAAASVCRQIGIPCIITAHHGGLVCPNGTLLHCAGQICKHPISRQDCLPCTLHTLPGGSIWGPIVRVLPESVGLTVARSLQRIPNIPFTSPSFLAHAAIVRKQAEIEVLKAKADVLVAPSAAMAEALQRNGIPSRKIRLIPHGIPLPQRKPVAPGLGQRPLRLLFVGRICAVKGVHVLLEALEGMAPEHFELHIVGGAVTRPEQLYLGGLQKRFSAGNIHWHGKCSPEQVEQWLGYCDVMVHPAIYMEVFGLTIAEAMAMGRPVVASRCGGAEMQIEQGRNGWLVPANDVAALRQQLNALISQPAEVVATAERLGSVRDLAQHVADLVGLYRELSPVLQGMEEHG